MSVGELNYGFQCSGYRRDSNAEGIFRDKCLSGFFTWSWPAPQ
jgi:hypothetical protein